MSITDFFRSIFHIRPKAKPPVPLATRAWEGDGTWPFVAVQDGEDIVLRARTGAQMRVTWFGGDNDPQDNGETASGIRTRGNPTISGCALPMGCIKACQGSPIPRLPWRTLVTVSDGTRDLTVPLIDIGPAWKTRNTLDLTQYAFQQFAPLTDGRFVATSIRIHDVAKHFTGK